MQKTIEEMPREVNKFVASNFGDNPDHVWVLVEDGEHDYFLTAGKTWDELKPLLYRGNKDGNQ